MTRTTSAEAAEGPCQSCTNPQLARPMAVSGQYGCGRMMYSTFETSSTMG
ncbi:hypothetical protein [Enhygromyxa salina]|uniref:Uncharacterized protein n=1 Tax=Enhygromyxa salina TaxID=215803 RepID=A0A2S9YST4_9BACT|nr:hypothetical protein [Enhygromyxa salina]PRQ08171.1 hypothetical protein ENSA7_21430 [Enhygromyxa salina]